MALRIKVSGLAIKAWVDGTLKINLIDRTFGAGGVAFGGDQPKIDNLKIGYDVTGDDDIDDAGDQVVINETFGSTSVTVSHDDAGNLIDDGLLDYTYDAWNRLVLVTSTNDTDVTIQTAEFDATGRRMKKVVTNAGDHDLTAVYFHDGHKIIETRDGSSNVVQQFVRGVRYIGEIVMMRVIDKDDLYVHQDANWNVIALTDLGGSVVERYVYNPYGQFVVQQETSYGDRDGDGDVDGADKGTPGSTCTGTVAGACRILDLDFDGDYDAADEGEFDNLPQGLARHPGRRYTGVEQVFAHQGLLYEPELGSYHNRARQYHPTMRRFVQRDPVLQPGLLSGTGSLIALHDTPLSPASRVQLARFRNSGLDMPTQIATIMRLVVQSTTIVPIVQPRLGRESANPYEYLDCNPAVLTDAEGLAPKSTCIDWFRPWNRGPQLCTREITPLPGMPSEHCCDGACHTDGCGPACASLFGYCIYCPAAWALHLICDVF